MKNYRGPNRKNSSAEIYRAIRTDIPGKTNAYSSGETYGRAWAIDNSVSLQEVKELASSKIETPSSALVNEMIGRARTPRADLINLGMILGINTKEIKSRSAKFYNALRNYDAGFVAGALREAH